MCLTISFDMDIRRNTTMAISGVRDFGNTDKFKYIVTVYGYNFDPFPWATCKKSDTKSTNSDNFTYTNGIIIKDVTTNLLYIVSSRKSMIGYQQYAVVYRAEDYVMTCVLRVLFQHVDYNVMVFGTLDTTYFDYTKSTIINSIETQIVEPDAYVSSPKTHLFKPSKKYMAIHNEQTMKNKNSIEYNIHTYDITYSDSVSNYQTYVPNLYVHLFKIKSDLDAHNSIDLIGAMVITKKSQCVGPVINIIDDVLYVTPMKYIENGFQIFLKYQKNQIYDQAFDIIQIPIDDTDYISDIFEVQQNNLVCFKTTKVMTADGGKLIKKNDILVSVNDMNLSLDKGEIVIYEQYFNRLVSLPIYCKFHPLCLEPICFTLKRKNKNIKLGVTGVSTESSNLKLSIMDKFYPDYLVPHIKLNGLIITTLTHELIDILYTCTQSDTLKNEIIDKLMNDKAFEVKHELVIIDCYNSDLLQNYKFPVLSKKRKTMVIPFLTKVNNTSVKTMSEIVALLSSNPKITTIHCSPYLDKQQQVTITMS